MIMRSSQPHLVRTPAAPTTVQTACAAQARWELRSRRERAGVQYQTGPRFGQQLAAAIKAGRRVG